MDENLIAKINDIKPWLILNPIVSPGNEDFDLLKFANRMGIKYGIIPIGWDNLSSKLFLYLKPDFVIERGRQNSDLAEKIFELDESKVFTVGVPHYEMYFEYQQKKDLKKERQEFLYNLDIPVNKKVLLFGGSLRPFDETSFLENLEDAIEDGTLGNVHIIYRPHPEREKRNKERSFFDEDFKHITFDKELKPAYLDRNIKYLPDLNKYLDLYNSIDGIISPLSSVMVEASLFGKPVLAMACEDGFHFGWKSAQSMAKREHFRILREFDWFTQCDEKETFIEDCKKLLEVTSVPRIGDKIKKDVGCIVYTDDKSYSQRILNAVCSQET
jgi:hypothetical protein